jgi:MFS family permease
MLFYAPLPVILGVGLVWGFAVVADSAQFSTLVTEHADQRFVGTALTLQLAVGYALTVTTIWLIPFARDIVGWQWAFVLLGIGPVVGIVAMLRLGKEVQPEPRVLAGVTDQAAESAR